MTAQISRRGSSSRLGDDGEPGVRFENSGKNPLLVPGFGYPVPIERPPEERFAHGFGDWAQNRLTAREIAMLRLMNDITDWSEWYEDIYNASIVADWANNAMSQDLISPAAWNWCLLELRDRADLYKKSSLTHALDSASRVCKSDDLMNPELLEELTANVGTLGASVDPDLFPLVYGKTRVLQGRGRVGRVNAVDYAGKGTASKQQIWRCSSKWRLRCDGTPRCIGPGRRGRGRGGAYACGRCGREDMERGHSSWDRRGHLFSADYQWLPCEISFDAEQQGIKISSYINNLHPREYPSLYETVEKCIRASIQPWNEVLVKRDRGRIPERIRTYGPQWSPPPPSQEYLDYLESMAKVGYGTEYEIALLGFRNTMSQPDSPAFLMNRRQRRSMVESSSVLAPTSRQAVVQKYDRVKQWLHPEPGVSFTYQDWKRGKNNRAIVPGNNPPKEDHEFYNVDLAEDFAYQGLQVVIEIGNVELDPKQPSKPATDWKLSGLPNEHIVATSTIYFDSENMTPDSGSISFRVEADLDPDTHIWGKETGSRPYHPLAPLAGIYGFGSHEDIQYDYCGGPPWPSQAVQYLGDVKTPDGRLIAYPNVMQHRTNSYDLLDATRPGHRRLLKMHLVDPHYRICSTRNVPPQRQDWWYDAGMGRIDWQKYEIPPEIEAEIETHVGELPITMDDAERLREQFREERKKKYEVLNEDDVEQYRFALCEYDA